VQRKLAVLVGDVSLRATDAICVKQGHAELANRMGRESDAPRHSSKEWKRRRLPEPLIVDCSCNSLPSDAPKHIADGTIRARLNLPNLGGKVASFDQNLPARMRKPDDFRFRKRFAECRDCRKGVDDISEGAQSHD
jgi:hypothetical protein